MNRYAHISSRIPRHLGRGARLLVFVALLGAAVVSTDRATAAVTARVANGTLTVRGGAANDRMALRLQAGSSGILQVDGGDDGSADFSVDRASFTSIVVNAGGGADVVRVDEANGAFDDTEAIILNGQAGDDTLAGGQFGDRLSGGAGNDELSGLRGNDVVDGGPGRDAFAWKPLDGSDVVNGGSDRDLLRLTGSNVNETIALGPNGGRVRLTRGVGAVVLDVVGVEETNVAAAGGEDAVSVGDLRGTGLGTVTVDLAASGGAGGDARQDAVVVAGTAVRDAIAVTSATGRVVATGLAATVSVDHADATDRLLVNGLGGNDSVDASALALRTMRLVADGGPGSDALKGGPGDDTFVWNAGGGGDVVEGQAGDDLIAFNGSAAQDALSLAANAKRLRLSRNSGSVTLDAGGVEHVEVRAVGGADGIVVGDLAGTAVVEADIFLAASPLGGGDLQSDELTVTGTALGDSIAVVGETSRPTVLGLAVLVRLFDTEARDTLRVDGAAGPDTIDIASLSPAVLDANVVGGDGNDTINGGPAPDVLSGDAGDDTIDGGADGDVIFGDAGADAADGRPGDDSVLLGPGDDRFVATLGEGSDVVDGGLGTDTEQLDGSGLNEKMSLSASGSALRFVRDVANVVIGANGVEIVTVAAGSSGDTVAVGDLSGTNVSLVAIDNGVSARSTVGDEFADAVTVDGTIAADRLGVSSVGREVRVTGLPWEVRVAHPDAAVDSLAVRGLAGNDAVTVTGSLAALLKLTLDGGFGDDELFGGDGDDKLFGAEGDDSLGGAGGNDELHGGFGTDFLNGGFGADFYSCSGPGDLVFADATDTVSADCQ